MIWIIEIVQKKSGVVSTTDFQKTNYLKTNLLKQIKKNIFIGPRPIFSYLDVAKLGLLQLTTKKNKEKIQ